MYNMYYLNPYLTFRCCFQYLSPTQRDDDYFHLVTSLFSWNVLLNAQFLYESINIFILFIVKILSNHIHTRNLR